MPNRTPLFVRAAFAAIVGFGAALPAAAAPVTAAPPSWLHRLPSLVSEAVAQEVMKFEEISPESAAALEKGRTTTRARSGAAPAVPPVPPMPDVPEVPAIPPVSRAGDVVRIGSDIHIEENQVVDGDVFALQGDIEVDGHVKGNVATTGGNVHLGSTARVDGDVMCIGGSLTEESGAVVGGQRVTALRGEGRIRDRVRERIHERLEGDRSGGGGVGFSLSWLICTLLVGWLFARFAPGRTGVALAMLRNEPGGSLMVGFVVVLLLIPSVVALALAVAVLCITIVGIPLALLLMPAYALGLALLFLWGFTLGATVVGDRFASSLGGPGSLVRSTVMGILVVSGMLVASSILHFLPFFGWIAGLLWVLGFVTLGLATMAGAGALVRSKFGQGPGGRWWPPFPRPASSPPAAPVVPGPAAGAAAPGTAAPGTAVVVAAPPPAAAAPESYMPREAPETPGPGSPTL